MAEWRFDAGQAKQELRDSINSIPATPEGYSKVEETAASFHRLTPEQRADTNREVIAKRPAENTYGSETYGTVHKNDVFSLDKYGSDHQAEGEKYYTSKLQRSLEEKAIARKTKIFKRAKQVVYGTAAAITICGTLAGCVGLVNYAINVDKMVAESGQNAVVVEETTIDPERMAEEKAFAEKVEQANLNTQQANEALNKSIDDRYAGVTPLSENPEYLQETTKGRSM